MARKAVADMTLNQKQTRENDKFRKQQYDQALEEVAAAKPNDDIDKFRRDSYKEALRDAKAQHKA